MRKIILGIDYGKNIGLAYVDCAYANSELTMPMPYKILKTKEELLSEILKLNIEFIVVGWPLLLNGQTGSQCAKTQEMINFLKKRIDTPIYLQDERFSSKFTNSNDMQSAAWILETFLKHKFS